jgi:serine/threonine-protein kinase
MPLTQGQIINNRYRIVKQLGQGGFGAVYRAWDLNLNKGVALKENLDTSEEARRQFAREATVLANLSHPNLPRVTDHFSLPDQGQFLVMDYVDGEDLDTMVQRQGPLDPDLALLWVNQVAEALVYLHTQNPPVIHRDIKPANIRVRPDGQAILVDFGLVKFYDPKLRTTSGARAVTPGYSPPEQYGQMGTDIRADVYALAATLYTLVTGEIPPESITRVEREVLTPAQELNTRLSPAVGRAIQVAMSLSPSRRFQTVADFRSALSQPASAPGGETRVVEPISGPPAETVIAPISAVPPPAAVSTPTGTQKVDLPPVWGPPQPPGQGIAQPPASATQGSAAKKVILVALVGLILLLFMGFGGGAYIFANRRAHATQTARARALASLQAEQTRIALEATHTLEAQATALASTATAAAGQAKETAAAAAVTAQVFGTRTAVASTQQSLQAKGTAEAGATVAAVEATGRAVDAQAVLVYGPKSGSLAYIDPDTISSQEAGVFIENFVAEARFFNPFPTSSGIWDYGFVFRHQSQNNQYRLIIFSDKTWYMTNHTGSGDGKEIANGKISNLDTAENGSNLVRLVVQGDKGQLFINGVFVANLDLGARINAGDVLVAYATYKGHGLENKPVNYQDFTIWKLP